MEIQVRYNLHLKNDKADLTAAVRVVETQALQHIQSRMNGVGANKDVIDVEGFKENPFIAVHVQGKTMATTRQPRRRNEGSWFAKNSTIGFRIFRTM